MQWFCDSLMTVGRKRDEEMAERTGLEPATSGVTGRHSNHLNYRSAAGKRIIRGGT